MEKRRTPTASIYTLGCKVNQYESEAIAELLTKNGILTLPHTAICDAYIINTCTVTAESDRKARQFIRRAISKNPSAYIIVTGCLAQTAPNDIAKIKGVDVICGNASKLAVVNELLTLLGSENDDIHASKRDIPKILVSDISSAKFEEMSITRFDRTRAYVKIEDGCENHCAYCIIPAARGKVRSKSPESVISEIEALVANGCREIVLTGIETASYGKDLNGASLANLLCKIDKINGIGRVRLGSLDPSLITQSFVDTISSLKSLTPHFHLSLQSGSSKILALMRRKYNAEMAMNAIRLLRQSIPHVCFSTDVIVGFPQETDENFLETANFIKEADFLTVHIFPYSARKGTEAAKMSGQIDSAEKSRRLHALEEIAFEARMRAINSELASAPIKDVLFETYDGEYAYGHTDNFLEVAVKANRDLRSVTLPVAINHTDGRLCFGSLLNESPTI